MRFVTFATAGHVDHGKTTLIKALTGTDTDRLPEEKRRGMSIDIGFAYIDFPEEDLRVEILDVPGHERFIKNAVAGLVPAKGILLVVDACEGVMDQTVEHLKVALSLGIRGGVAVLTKIDKADEELVSIAEGELRELLSSEGAELQVLRVSPLTGEGMEELKEAIKREASKITSEDEEKPLRIFVDSAFTVKGYGTVLRGSCVEGCIERGMKVTVEPLGVIARVRNMQNHGRFVEKASAGERVALNLPEVERNSVERGYWILEPGTYEKSSDLILRTEEKLKTKGLYYLFFGMREVAGRLKEVAEYVYMLRTSEPVVARRGDRVVILSSEGRFLCGGEVLHPKAKVKKKEFIRENLRDLFERYEVYLLKEAGSSGLEPSLFKRLTGKEPSEDLLLKEGVKVGRRFYLRSYVERLSEKLSDFLESETEGSKVGVSKGKVKERFGLEEELLSYLLSKAGRFEEVEGLIVSKEREGKDPLFEKLMEVLESGIKEEGEVLRAGIPKEVIYLSVRRGQVHRIGEKFLVSDRLLKEYIEKLRNLGESFTVQEAKRTLALTRKYLIPLLEYLDYLGLTKREGNVRRWV